MAAPQPEAGPSNPKRARFDSKGDNNTSNLPSNLDVEKHALARRTEIAAMERAMKASRDSGAQRAFQSLPRHFRRRAASHNISRLPKRLRAKAKMEIMHEGVKVLKKKKFRNLPAAKKRKLLHQTRLDMLHGRQRNKAWLETHIWHAKRMKMIDIWGYRLAHTPTEKAFRPSYRATMHGVIVSDVSYYQTIELKGQFEALKQILSTICDAAAVAPSSKRFSAGIRECQISLYYYDTYPVGLIGPVTILWDTPPDLNSEEQPALRQLFIRFHPSILKAVTSAVEQAIQAFQRQAQDVPVPRNLAKETAFRSVGMYFRNFCACEITGPMATDTVKACLRPVNGTSEEKKKAWSSLPPPSAVPSGTIFALDIYDPRLIFPPKLSKPEQSHGKPSSVVPVHALASNERFWDSTIRKKLVAPRYKKVELDERRSKLLIPGTPLAAQAQDDRIPILLVQRTLLADSSPVSTTTPNTIVSGWTILLPSGWGSAFWHSLAYADTRIGGLRERAQQSFEAGIPHFPDDFPCTAAFKRDNDSKAKELREKWERKPPAKRVNYTKLDTRTPWKPDLVAVVEETMRRYTIAAQEQVAEGMDVDVPSAEKTKTGAKKETPWLLQGPLLSKILEKIQDSSSLVSTTSKLDLKKLNALLNDLITHERKKRSLPYLAEKLNTDLASRAVVKVSLTPLGRGAPCYNAMIYGLEKEQAEEVRKSLKQPGWGDLDAQGIVERMQVKKGKGKELAGKTMEENAEAGSGDEEEEEEVEEENEPTDTAFRQPDASKIIGYITTGNMSLARGRGYGIGSVSLIALVALIMQEKEARLGKQDPKLLVLFRNPSSRVCRAATLQVMT